MPIIGGGPRFGGLGEFFTWFFPFGPWPCSRSNYVVKTTISKRLHNVVTARSFVPLTWQPENAAMVSIFQGCLRDRLETLRRCRWCPCTLGTWWISPKKQVVKRCFIPEIQESKMAQQFRKLGWLVFFYEFWFIQIVWEALGLQSFSQNGNGS